MKKGILMDMGDTLIHLESCSFNRALKKIYQLALFPKVKEEEFMNYANLTRDELFKNRLQIEIKCQDYIRLLKNRFQLSFTLNLEELEWNFALEFGKVRYVKDVKEVLSFFKKKNIRLIVLSNTMFSSKTIQKQLGELASYFEEIIASSEYVARKPDQSFFELGIGRMNLKKEEIVYIGNDYFFDVYGSNQVGLDVIWLNENHLEPLKEYGNLSYQMITSYQELMDDEHESTKCANYF